MGINYNGAPFEYDYVNAYNSRINPSTMHSNNTGLVNFFSRYLLQRAISVFKWTLPDTWEKNYFWYTVYCYGFASIVNTNRYGVIPQHCGLDGRGIMYQPTHAVISNPLLRGVLRPIIGQQCALIRLQPDYGGVMDLVGVYADAMALTLQTAGVNISNSQLSYVFFAQNKAGAESYKSMFDKIASGEATVVIDKQLLTEDGKPTWLPFANNLSSNYLGGELLANLQEWERRFDEEIGIPHTNTQKKERLVTGEVHANALESCTRAELWLEQLKDGCDVANRLFGIDMGVEWRIDPRETMEVESIDTENPA